VNGLRLLACVRMQNQGDFAIVYESQSDMPTGSTEPGGHGVATSRMSVAHFVESDH
jgi:hypothetical protein